MVFLELYSLSLQESPLFWLLPGAPGGTIHRGPELRGVTVDSPQKLATTTPQMHLKALTWHQVPSTALQNSINYIPMIP